MNKLSLITSAAGVALLLASAAPALADDSVSANGGADASVNTTSGENHDGNGLLPKLRAGASAKAHVEAGEHASSSADRMQKMDERAGNAIDARIKSLQELIARLGKMKLLSADTLATVQAALNAEIQQLTDLKAKISADTSADTLKADIQSITKGNRVYLLVEPKARIAAAASRVDAVVTQLTTLGGKLQARITAAQTAGVDVSVAVTAMSDYNVKIADAKVQADAAVTETAHLSVDNGDKTAQAANTAALKDARTKLAAAEADLKAARKDAMTIAGVVKGKGEVKTTTSTNTTTP